MRWLEALKEKEPWGTPSLIQNKNRWAYTLRAKEPHLLFITKETRSELFERDKSDTTNLLALSSSADLLNQWAHLLEINRLHFRRSFLIFICLFVPCFLWDKASCCSRWDSNSSTHNVMKSGSQFFISLPHLSRAGITGTWYSIRLESFLLMHWNKHPLAYHNI